MAEPISCVCGYRGPGSVDRGSLVCPICRTPAAAALPGAAGPPPVVPGSRGPGSAASAGALVPEDLPALGESATTAGTYSVPCPNGHVSKLPEEALGEELVCPRCNAAFVPRLTDSVEYRRERSRRRREEEERRARRWLTAAVVAAVLVLLSFVAMVLIALSS